MPRPRACLPLALHLERPRRLGVAHVQLAQALRSTVQINQGCLRRAAAACISMPCTPFLDACNIPAPFGLPMVVQVTISARGTFPPLEGGGPFWNPFQSLNLYEASAEMLGEYHYRGFVCPS
eukprot:scaffold168926_cov19-Tisochrysis_lutea.AAC.1